MHSRKCVKSYRALIRDQSSDRLPANKMFTANELLAKKVEVFPILSAWASIFSTAACCSYATWVGNL
mgnify:CR=1 FL=1